MARYGELRANDFADTFLRLATSLTTYGVAFFRELYDRDQFVRAAALYDNLLQQRGNQTPLHSYVDLQSSINLLYSGPISQLALNPLATALIAYVMGEPPIIVDARCKDTGPLTLCSQENMLHLDNGCSGREIKILVSWEAETKSGSKGQNLVVIPGVAGLRVLAGTLQRQTESDFTFSKRSDVLGLLEWQALTLKPNGPLVVEVTDPKPMTAIFIASDVVHHRYRTEVGAARSSITIAFQPAAKRLRTCGVPLPVPPSCLPLTAAVLGSEGFSGLPGFILALHESADAVGQELLKLLAPNGLGPEYVAPEALRMREGELCTWLKNVTAGQSLLALKRTAKSFPSRGKSSRASLEQCAELMRYDKHGPLNLLFHGSPSDELRKSARIRLRELPQQDLCSRLKKWRRVIARGTGKELQPVEIAHKGLCLAAELQRKLHMRAPSRIDGIRSLIHFAMDLSEAVVRCGDEQEFATTSLFIFLCVDEAVENFRGTDGNLFGVGSALLQHYLAVAIPQRMLKTTDYLPMLPSSATQWGNSATLPKA